MEAQRRGVPNAVSTAREQAQARVAETLDRACWIDTRVWFADLRCDDLETLRSFLRLAYIVAYREADAATTIDDAQMTTDIDAALQPYRTRWQAD